MVSNFLRVGAVAVAVVLTSASIKPPPPRTDVVRERTSVPQLTVIATPNEGGVQYGGVGWTLLVRNDGSMDVKLVWDASSYVDPDGVTQGRLIRGKTRNIHRGNPQPPSPIPPGSALREWAAPEELLSAIENAPTGPSGKEYPSLPASGVGRLRLVFELMSGEQVAWEGDVRWGTRPPTP
jgi:hypothetical protein